jgi:Papain family cysteine protease
MNTIRALKSTLALCGLAAVLGFAAPTTATAQEATEQIDPRQFKAAQRLRAKALRAAKKWARRNPAKYAQLIPPRASTEPGSIGTTFTTANGETRPAVLDSLLHTVLDVGFTELRRRDTKNLANLYQQLFEILPSSYRDGLPDPSLVRTLPGGLLTKRVYEIGRIMSLNYTAIRIEISQTAYTGFLLTNPIGTCSAEIGFEVAGTDSENSARCLIADYATDGIMRTVDFAMKGDLTCVKEQRRRGTCVAHSVNAAVETRIQVEGGVPENLSEQNLYRWAEINTDWTNRYTYGLNTDEVFSALDTEDYELQYESNWNYNQSPNRSTTLNAANQFSNSCSVNYTGEMCTDFAFQSTEAFNGVTWIYTIPAPAASGWEVLDYTVIPDLDFFIPNFQIDTAVLAVEAELPLVMSIGVPPSFDNPDANGYVNFVAGETSRGSHAILAVGFVANADLPAGAPLDPDGEGYFVIKNSWSTGYGDCGFAYLSHPVGPQLGHGIPLSVERGLSRPSTI